MTLDSKISFISGAALTTISAGSEYAAEAVKELTPDAIIYMAVYGLVGGFFGIAGKQLFYFIKKRYERNS
jgi:H+/Cl- antiporter ClcA